MIILFGIIFILSILVGVFWVAYRDSQNYLRIATKALKFWMAQADQWRDYYYELKDIRKEIVP